MKHYNIIGRLGNQMFQFARCYTEAISCNYESLCINNIPITAKNLLIPLQICNDGIFEGYFESEQYFDTKLIYDIYKPLDSQIQIIKGKYDLTNKKSCFISIRRGDFYLLRHSFVCLKSEFYKHILFELIKECGDFDNIFITTDDYNYVKQTMGDILLKMHCILLENTSLTETINIASCCQYHIISNSTFSWWCSWIAERYNNSKIFCPSNHFLNGFNIYEDSIYFPSRWNKIDITDFYEK